MKKLPAVLMAIALLTCALPAHANAEPFYNSVSLIVTNPEGAEFSPIYTGENSTIPYGTEVTGILSTSRGTEVLYQGNEGLVSTRDLSASDEYFSVSNAQEVPSVYSYEAYFFDTDGVALRKGPGDFYSKTGYTVPSETIYEYRYTDSNFGWAYYDDGENTGWFLIDALFGIHCGVAQSYQSHTYNYTDDYGSFMTAMSGIQMTESPYSSKVIETIPASTACRYRFLMQIKSDDTINGSYNDVLKTYYYVEYNGEKGWVLSNPKANENIAEVSQKYNIINPYKVSSEENDTVNVYDEVFGSTVVGTLSLKATPTLVPEYTLYTEDFGWYYVSTWQYSGWIDGYDLEMGSTIYAKQKTADNGRIKLYMKPRTNSGMTGAIPEGAEYSTIRTFTCDRYLWYFCDCNGVTGWARDDTPQTEDTAIAEPVETEPVTTAVPETEAQTTDQAVSRGEFSTAQKAALQCALGAVIIALISAAVIILLRKKSRDKRVRLYSEYDDDYEDNVLPSKPKVNGALPPDADEYTPPDDEDGYE